ncbi:MAG: amino acid ABC transporter substrate-binding protein, partial [Caldilineae bacterium]
PPPPSPPPGAANDLLAVVQQRGYLKVAVRVWPDSRFKPPLFRNPFGALDGYEVAVAHALADRLDVGLEMAESDPRQIAAGGWNGQWDMALAWLPITDNALQTLLFSDPYALERGALAVHAENTTIGGMQDLPGKRVGVPAQTVYAQILGGEGVLAGGVFIGDDVPAGVTVVPYNRDGNALRDLAAGDGTTLDAVLHSEYILDAAVAEGMPLKVIARNLFPLPVGVAFDRAGLPAERLRQAVNGALAAMRQDGSLDELAFKWYERDILP